MPVLDVHADLKIFEGDILCLKPRRAFDDAMLAGALRVSSASLPGNGLELNVFTKDVIPPLYSEGRSQPRGYEVAICRRESQQCSLPTLEGERWERRHRFPD
jgi:hypothetical protein